MAEYKIVAVDNDGVTASAETLEGALNAAASLSTYFSSSVDVYDVTDTADALGTKVAQLVLL